MWLFTEEHEKVIVKIYGLRAYNVFIDIILCNSYLMWKVIIRKIGYDNDDWKCLNYR